MTTSLQAKSVSKQNTHNTPRKVLFIAKYGIIKLYFGNSGLKAKKLKFRFEKEMLSMDWHDYQDYIYG